MLLPKGGDYVLGILRQIPSGRTQDRYLSYVYRGCVVSSKYKNYPTKALRRILEQSRRE